MSVVHLRHGLSGALVHLVFAVGRRLAGHPGPRRLWLRPGAEEAGAAGRRRRGLPVRRGLDDRPTVEVLAVEEAVAVVGIEQVGRVGLGLDGEGVVTGRRSMPARAGMRERAFLAWQFLALFS